MSSSSTPRISLLLCLLSTSRMPPPTPGTPLFSHGESVHSRAGLDVQGVSQPLQEKWIRSPSRFGTVEMDLANSSRVSFLAAHLCASMVNQLTNESRSPPLSSHVE
jgi:hypothetical protein